LPNEKAIHIDSPSSIPTDILSSVTSLDDYLEQNIIDNTRDEKVRTKLAKARHAQRTGYLKWKEKQEEEKTKVLGCKK